MVHIFFQIFVLVNFLQLETDSLEYYQTEKLKQEIHKLQEENKISPLLKVVPIYGGLITAMVAIIGAFVSIQKYLQERKLEAEKREFEVKVKQENQFNNILKDLSSDNPSLKSSAAVSILTFLQPENEKFHRQVYLILLSTLKNSTDKFDKLLIKIFERALRTYLPIIRSELNEHSMKNLSIEIDLSRMCLDHIDFQHLDLSYFDFAFSKIRHANFRNCNLNRAKGFQADFSDSTFSEANLNETRFQKVICKNTKFHKAIVTSADFKNAVLTNAEFQEAKLQSTHFDEANIIGAKFEKANLNDTFFRNVIYSNVNLKSLLRSENKSWANAHFSDDLMLKLKNHKNSVD